MSGYRHWAGRRILGGKSLQLYWQLLVSNFLATSTGTLLAEGDLPDACPGWQKRIPGDGCPAAELAAVWQQFPWYWHRIGRREYLEVGLLELYWQLFGSNFLGTSTVLAEEST
jgi:hypothetical protein